jgi:hypothetical protein
VVGKTRVGRGGCVEEEIETRSHGGVVWRGVEEKGGRGKEGVQRREKRGESGRRNWRMREGPFGPRSAKYFWGRTEHNFLKD